MSSITVVSLLVLITFIGAVVIYVRSNKKKRRYSIDVEKQDLNTREWRVGDCERHGSTATNETMLSKGFGRPGGAIRFPPRAAERRSTALSQGTREAAIQEFNKGRDGGAREAGISILESSSTPAVPIGKIERITGNALSNDFYNHRASGSSHSRGNSANAAAMPRNHRYPSPSATPVLSFRPLVPDIDLSPISSTTSASTPRDSPLYECAKYLSSPVSTVIAHDMNASNSPNLSSEPSERSSSTRSSRFSYTQLYLGSNLGKHISTQYNRLKEPRKSPQTPQDDAERSQASPRSSSSSDSPIVRKPSRLMRSSSEFTGTISPVEPAGRGHSQRLSWSGRSVLELDSPGPSKQYNFISSSQSKPHVLRRIDRNLPVECAPPPKFATSPKSCASRHHNDYPPPPPPPIPADPSDVEGDLSDFTLPMPPMFRSFSDSKMSVVSVPSTISSVSTFVGRNTIGGLSPTPARHSVWNTPDYEDVISSHRYSAGGSIVLTETSETSNMTEAEIEMEMRKIRERAKRASEERKGSRRRNEEDQGGQRGTEVVGMPRIGHRFF